MGKVVSLVIVPAGTALPRHAFEPYDVQVIPDAAGPTAAVRMRADVKECLREPSHWVSPAGRLDHRLQPTGHRATRRRRGYCSGDGRYVTPTFDYVQAIPGGYVPHRHCLVRRATYDATAIAGKYQI
jgi:hypothetical protein